MEEQLIDTWSIHDRIHRYLLATGYGLWEWGVR
jgi:hypothetical protein